MRSAARITTLKKVLALPTAPFAEREVITFVRAFCRDRKGVTVRTDPAGNLMVRLKRGTTRGSRPVCLAAHMDHPGFVATSVVAKGRIRAAWRGGVRPEFFPDAGVRFWCTDRWVKGVIRQVRCSGRGDNRVVRDVLIESRRRIPVGAIGMWDLPDPVVRGRRIHARACDDLAGLAAMLCCMDELCRARYAVDAMFLFTRAEEVGFVGALAACRNKTIPKKAVVVAVENSSEIPGVSMGNGPILRVGDKAEIFSPAVTAYCGRVAEQLARRDKRFRYQRKLMDGGTCESTAYCHYGYDATGICIALGNYHNMDRAAGRIAPEYIHLDDFDHLVTWFVALCKSGAELGESNDALDRRLAGLERRYQSLLMRTRHGSGV